MQHQNGATIDVIQGGQFPTMDRGSKTIDPTSEVDDPIFILCGARSGSTLLRILLDCHPHVLCPPETNLSTVFERIHFACATLYDNPQQAQEAALRQCRRFAHETIDELAYRAGAQRWCDKSLTSLFHAEALIHVFPEAKFICLQRRCTDFIISGVEACTWGYGGYGFEPYVRQNPENIVRALALYWVDHTEQLLSFEDAHEASCYRLRYEDLVEAPQTSLRSLLPFLGLDWVPELDDPARSLTQDHGRGPGDFKINGTREISTASIGQGERVPKELIPPPLLERIAALEETLLYLPEHGGQSDQSSDLPPAGVEVLEHAQSLAHILTVKAANTVCRYAGVREIALALEDTNETIILNLAEGQVRIDGDSSSVVLTFVLSTEVLDGLVSHNHNLVSLLRTGHVRMRANGEASEPTMHEYLQAFIDVLAAPAMETVYA